MNPYPLILILVLLVSCNFSDSAVKNSTSGNVGSRSGTNTSAIASLSVPKIRIKNYNQYNMSLEKLTGINRSNHNELFESIKGSLPADNEIEALTPFNLIAMTRLADAYCTDFVERETTTGLAADINPLIVTDVRDFLFSRFLDVEPGSTRFESLKVEVENVLRNRDGSNNVIFPGALNNLAGNKSLVVGACVTILASPYITLLE